MRIALSAALTLAALGVAAAPAAAGITTTFTAGKLTVQGDGADDVVAITCPGTQLLVNGAPIGVPACGTPSSIELKGGGGADRLDLSGVDQFKFSLSATRIEGEDGNDELYGTKFGANEFTGTLLGGSGDDKLVRNFDVVAQGGIGNDRLEGLGAPGATYDGGEGTDTAALDISIGPPAPLVFTPEEAGITLSLGDESSFGPWASIESVDLVLNNGDQTVDGGGFSGTLRVDGLGGTDTLIGGSGADEFNGGAGNDVLEGSGGADRLFGDSGDDTLRARDGFADTGDCGPGADTLVADLIDAISACENVDVPPLPPPVAVDVTNPQLGLKRARLTRRRLRLPVTCPASESRCAGSVALTGVGRRGGKTVRRKLGSIAFSLTAGQAKTLTMRVSRGERRALRRMRGRRLRVGLDVQDAAGNRTQKTQRVGLRL